MHQELPVADPGFSRGGGVNPPGGAWTRQIFPKTAWNRKNLDAQGGACVPHAPPRSANDYRYNTKDYIPLTNAYVTTSKTMDTVTAQAVSTVTVTKETVTMEETSASGGYDVMKILQVVIACLGVFTNLIVVVVFLNNKQMRRKIPNICIINQVSKLLFLLPKILKGLFKFSSCQTWCHPWPFLVVTGNENIKKIHPYYIKIYSQFPDVWWFRQKCSIFSIIFAKSTSCKETKQSQNTGCTGHFLLTTCHLINVIDNRINIGPQLMQRNDGMNDWTEGYFWGST